MKELIIPTKLKIVIVPQIDELEPMNELRLRAHFSSALCHWFGKYKLINYLIERVWFLFFSFLFVHILHLLPPNVFNPQM